MTDSEQGRRTRKSDNALGRTSSLDEALQALNNNNSLTAIAKTQDVRQARQAAAPATEEPDRMGIRQVSSEVEMDQVHRLVHDAYVERGYVEPQPDGRLVLYPHLEKIPETIVLITEEDGCIVGTNSLTLDGPNGLPSDIDFKRDCTAIRKEGRPLAGSWRLCTRTGYRDERRIVLDLIAKTVQLTQDFGVKTCVFTIHPRHASVYEKLLNMREVARKETTVKGLQNAPAVFMRCDYENLPPWTLKPS